MVDVIVRKKKSCPGSSKSVMLICTALPEPISEPQANRLHEIVARRTAPLRSRATGAYSGIDYYSAGSRCPQSHRDFDFLIRYLPKLPEQFLTPKLKH